MDEIEFLQKILQIDTSSPSGNEDAVAKVLQARAERAGLYARRISVAPNRTNLEVRLDGLSGTKLFLCGHMDTVAVGEGEWSYPPFFGKLVGNRLYGRGASDMKSGLAAMYLALEKLYEDGVTLPGKVVFLATAGEEVDSCGARAYLQEKTMEDVDALVIGEPTNEKIAIGHKGALWLEINVFGKTAHGSMPQFGVNAVRHMAHIIEWIEEYALQWKWSQNVLGESSMAVTKIAGGMQTNVIPDFCSLHVDIRTVPPQRHDELIAELKQKLNDFTQKYEGLSISVKPLLDRAAILSDPSQKIIETALSVKGLKTSDCRGMPYYTDGSVLNPRNTIPTLIYGPGNEKLAHQPDEWVDVDAYLRSIHFYKELVLQYFSSS